MQLARQDVALPAARAWLEPPRSLCSLWGLKTHVAPSLCSVTAPAGVAAFYSFIKTINSKTQEITEEVQSADIVYYIMERRQGLRFGLLPCRSARACARRIVYHV